MKIYEYTSQEVNEVIPFRNQTFGQISQEHWEAMNCTAVVARQDDRLVGFIPLQYREQCLNPHVTIPVVYENAVGVAQDRRGQGIGTAMIEKAARFISDRADALMVIRGGEQSIGYRFYRKTGHSDLVYARQYTLPPETRLPCGHAQEIRTLDRQAWTALEPQLLALYQTQYGRFGGGQQRKQGYWDTILNGHVYRERVWSLVVLMSGTDRMAGYMAAVQGMASPSQETYVYEVVGKSDSVVEQLLGHARTLSENGTVIVPQVSLANPVCATLERLGFVAGESTSQIMARILRPDRIFGRLAADTDLLDTLSLTVSTPHRTLVVNEPAQPRYRVHLQTKEAFLSRLFCCRLDLAAAIEMELVRWNGHDDGLKRTLSQVFEFSEWVQWFSDYV